MRGKVRAAKIRIRNVGSPPRVRGKARHLGRSGVKRRITPACAGKRRLHATSHTWPWDHPRVCGEKQQNNLRCTCVEGSPPRVRGKVIRGLDTRITSGITPACAGKSTDPDRQQDAARDHPRVCGEKGAAFLAFSSYWGSPPRVRGKAAHVRQYRGGRRITPACAGKSLSVPGPPGKSWDHPRVCGEKALPELSSRSLRGSPPRVRGKGWRSSPCEPLRGITPACAGKRRSAAKVPKSEWDHPRVCGEKQAIA